MSEEEIYYNRITAPLAYEGASSNYKTGLDGLIYGDHDSLAVRELRYLQMRTAHAIRNNGYASTALDKNAINLRSITIRWLTPKKKLHKEMQALWDEFVSKPTVDGYGTLDTVQAIHNNSVFQAGNCFYQRQTRRRGNPAKVPFKIREIPAELHAIEYTDPTKNIFYGIQFADGKPIKYFFNKSVQEILATTNSLKFNNYIEIDADELFHSFYRKFPGQWLGIPELASTLLSLYDIDRLTDATIAKQQAAQAIAWIIENTSLLAPNAVGAPKVITEQQDDASLKKKVIFNAEGGSVQYLNKGEKINFYQSTDIGENLTKLIKQELQKDSAAINVPYHQLTGDFSGIDFSTLRGINIELRNFVEFRHLFYTIPVFLNPIAESFKAFAVLYNSRVSSAIPSFELPRWYGVDDLKDVQADLLEVQAGISTFKSKLTERNLTVEDIVEDRELLKSLGLEHLLTTEKNPALNQSNNKEANSNSTGN
jgi:lambda family phage portal protein